MLGKKQLRKTNPSANKNFKKRVLVEERVKLPDKQLFFSLSVKEQIARFDKLEDSSKRVIANELLKKYMKKKLSNDDLTLVAKVLDFTNKDLLVDTMLNSNNNQLIETILDYAKTKQTGKCILTISNLIKRIDYGLGDVKLINKAFDSFFYLTVKDNAIDELGSKLVEDILEYSSNKAILSALITNLSKYSGKVLNDYAIKFYDENSTLREILIKFYSNNKDIYSYRFFKDLLLNDATINEKTKALETIRSIRKSIPQEEIEKIEKEFLNAKGSYYKKICYNLYLAITGNSLSLNEQQIN